MSNNKFQQAKYDYLHNNKILSKRLTYKVKHYFDRVNLWDAELWKKYKDYKRRR